MSRAASEPDSAAVSSQMVVTYDVDGSVLEANELFLRTLGYTLEEVIGKQHKAFFTCASPPCKEHAALWERIYRGELQTDKELQCIGKSGEQVWLKATFAPLLDANNTLIRVVQFAIDVTEQKRRCVVEADQKAMFIANMSHEIRTPMNGILGMLALLKDTMPPEWNGPGRSYLDTCMRSAESLLTVLNDILLYSRCKADTIELEHSSFNLSELLEDVLFMTSSAIAFEDLEVTYFLRVDVPPFLIGDGARLRQVLLNLLGNAAKFTRRGEISLNVSVQSVSGGSLGLRFTVQDTGIGISEREQLRLFSPFHQIDSSITRQYGGTGLGLAISRHLVMLFGGDISVQSSLGRGSRFTFTASFILDPARINHSLDHVLGIREERSLVLLRGLRVVIVDDSATTCALLESTLEYFGCETISTQSAMDGVDLLRSCSLRGKPIEVMLIDFESLKMGMVSGHDPIHEIEVLGLTTVTIGMTRSALLVPELLKKNGISAVAMKPIHRGHVLRTIISTLPSTFTRTSTLYTSPKSGDCINSSITVLVVEDNEVNRIVVSAILRRAGYQVVEAVSGIEALEKLTDRVSVILMDVHMPILDGITAARLLLKMRATLSVIYLTADGTKETQQKCEASGALCTLLKPIKRQLLLDTIAAVPRKLAKPP